MSASWYGVFGASGFGREVMPMARQCLNAERAQADLVFIDDDPQLDVVNGHAVLGFEEFKKQAQGHGYVSLAIADGQTREKLAGLCSQAGMQAWDLRAANVSIFDDVHIGAGAILCSFVCITSNVRIGKQFHANIYSYIAHDCVIGDFVTFAPRVSCNGNVVIEDHAYIGTGAVLRQGKPGKPLRIGRGAVVGMGAVVTKDVPPGVTVVGNPARPLVKT